MEITSEQAVQELLADPNSPWHEYRGLNRLVALRNLRSAITDVTRIVHGLSNSASWSG